MVAVMLERRNSGRLIDQVKTWTNGDAEGICPVI
jgi:hypothetical protein